MLHSWTFAALGKVPYSLGGGGLPVTKLYFTKDGNTLTFYTQSPYLVYCVSADRDPDSEQSLQTIKRKCCALCPFPHHGFIENTKHPNTIQKTCPPPPPLHFIK